MVRNQTEKTELWLWIIHYSIFHYTAERSNEKDSIPKRETPIFGFSFDEDEGGEEEVVIGDNVPIYDEAKGYEEPVEILDKLTIYKVSIFLTGPVWKPSRNGDRAYSFYLGISADPKWNFLVKEAAEEVGWKFSSYSSMCDGMITAKMAKLQRRFVEAIRQRLLKAGIVGLQLGSEMVAVDFEAIHIIE